jgi:hypothetical protein
MRSHDERMVLVTKRALDRGNGRTHIAKVKSDEKQFSPSREPSRGRLPSVEELKVRFKTTLKRTPLIGAYRFLKNCGRGIKKRADREYLSLRIQGKWMSDKRQLPLTRAHKELYRNIHLLYWRELHDFPNLVKCRDFNDRIQWLKLFDQSEEMVRCSDKILVRDYIRERIGEKYLVRLYQVRDHFSQIDFDALPKAFVIKVNHDSGTVTLVRDKTTLDRVAAEAKVETALKAPFGWENGEWAYAFVKPRVLVEEFIEPENPKPPPDYKFYVVEGKVRFLHYIYDRGFDTKEQTVDVDGNDLATSLYPHFKLGTGFAKPEPWEEMISVAERLGAGFKCVRVDLFCPGNKVYAGELTFWPMFGCYQGSGQKKLGQLLDFDRTTYKPCILPALKDSRKRG